MRNNTFPPSTPLSLLMLQLRRQGGALPGAGGRWAVLHLGRVLLLPQPIGGLLQKPQHRRGESDLPQRPSPVAPPPVHTRMQPVSQPLQKLLSGVPPLSPPLHLPLSCWQVVLPSVWGCCGGKMSHNILVNVFPVTRAALCDVTSLLCLPAEGSSGSRPLRLHAPAEVPSALPPRWHHRPAGLLELAVLEGALSRPSGNLPARMCPAAVPLTPYQSEHHHGSIAASPLITTCHETVLNYGWRLRRGVMLICC